MDWNEYKALCDQPFMFSRWMLEQTLELAQDKTQLADVLARILRGRVLTKPIDHRGGRVSDMFDVRIDLEQADAIYRMVEQAERLGRRTTATKQRGLGGFVAAWRDYKKFLEGERAS